MGSSILTYVLAPFEQPFAQFPGVFVAVAVLAAAVGFGVGRIPGAYRRRVLTKRLDEAKRHTRQADAEGRRFAELLGITATTRTALTRLSNDQLRAKATAFVSALRAQLAAWTKELDTRLAAGPPRELSGGQGDAVTHAWRLEAQQLLADSSARLEAYQQRFKVDAVMLRTEIARRLERPPERSPKAVARVSSPVDLTAMADVAEDLAALTALLPDDATARAQAAERRRRERKRGRTPARPSLDRRS